jgi:hypothetical protein
MTKETRQAACLPHSDFVIPSSFGICHSSFGAVETRCLAQAPPQRAVGWPLRNDENLFVVRVRILHLGARRHPAHIHLFPGRVRTDDETRFSGNLKAVWIIAFRGTGWRCGFGGLRGGFGQRLRRRSWRLVGIIRLGGRFRLRSFIRVTRNPMPHRRLIQLASSQAKESDNKRRCEEFHRMQLTGTPFSNSSRND